MHEGELGDKVYFVLDSVVFKAVFGEIVKLHPGHCIEGDGSHIQHVDMLQ